jgi:hypothetical protein
MPHFPGGDPTMTKSEIREFVAKIRESDKTEMAVFFHAAEEKGLEIPVLLDKLWKGYRHSRSNCMGCLEMAVLLRSSTIQKIEPEPSKRSGTSRRGKSSSRGRRTSL